ncbi:hypothetical protein [Spirosoma sp. KNUC1025]|uniref:hypothetical protein n=1 Tax=Spirosoma sp. KNUC1025 TaxID=2894082 RepID=UPI0038643F07|nr:hypothetical protein LN737_14415 [Spirosoma sp. KNUC1025]
MNDPKLQDLSTPDLLKRKKLTQFLTGLLAGVLLVLLGIKLYSVIVKDDGILALATPLALTPIVVINLSTLKAIKAELRAREHQQ